MILTAATALAVWTGGVHAPGIAFVDLAEASFDAAPTKLVTMPDAAQAEL